MADTALQVVLSPFLGVLFDKLSSFLQSEIAQSWGVKKQMEKLSRTLSTIKDVLDDAEEKQVTNVPIQNWLRELKDATYDADDLLDECAYEGLQLAPEKRHSGYVKQVIDSVTQVNFRRKIGKRIRELRERFDEIAETRSKFHLQKGSVEKKAETLRERETSSTLTEPLVLGRDEDKENIVKLLLNNVNSQEDVFVYPLLGRGGVGKTTLAQMVYNDVRVAEHFDVRSWVYVSDDFDVKRLIRAIIVSLSRNPCDLEDLDPLQGRLEEMLCAKRFLLVLDDVWNDNQEEWCKLKCSLKGGLKGSSVIVTTRLETVASITGTLPACRLNVLSEDDCWDLFKQRAFGLGNEEKPELVKIGKEIVMKCRGVPLAAKALGGLMRFKNEENEWLFVRDTEIWDLPQSSKIDILPVLKLSYDHLPSHLKQCFAYCSIFPKDYKIGKNTLIHLWMANGFIQSKGAMELEDVGNEIFNALLWRSFFQDLERDQDGSIKTCKIHDLMHDLACHVGFDECSVMDMGKGKNIDKRTRHLSLGFGGQELSPDAVKSTLKSLPCLRSLIGSDLQSPVANPQFIFSNLLRLRALDLCSKSAEELPDTIGKMIHLKYLNLSFRRIVLLPESICELRNLQTFYLIECSALEKLPRGMRKLRSLRHLYIWGCVKLTKMPIGIGSLTCLQRLCFFVVSLETGCGIKELKGMNLGGELWLRRLENVKKPTDAKETLVGKQNLRLLSLSWSDSHLQENSIEVIEGLQPHSNVRQLFIEGYKGLAFPSWFTCSALPKLTVICLSGWKKCEHLSPLGTLPLLKVLKVYSMDSVRFIHKDTDGESVDKGFPSLENLRLDSMPSLEGLSSSQRNRTALFPCLNMLTLVSCSKLVRLPSLAMLAPLKGLIIHSIDSVGFYDEETGRRVIERFPKLELLLVSMPDLEGWKVAQGTEEAIFPCLEELVIEKWSKLPSLGKLPLVKFLSISAVDSVKFIDKEIYGDSFVKGFPSLEILEISKVGNLDGWSSSQESEEALFPSLKSLSVIGCSTITGFPLPSSLQLVTLECCDEIVLGSLQNLPFLSSLKIGDFDELKDFPERMLQNLASLQTLWIYDCRKLVSFPEEIRNLSFLKELYISDCPCLKYLPELEMSSLEKLSILNCESLTTLSGGFRHLLALQKLDINRCAAFDVPMEDFQHLTALEYLKLGELPKLTYVPEGLKHATKLREIEIENCSNLKELPKGMQHLTSVQSLRIYGCHPELERRCEKDKGQDWDKISHIQKVVIVGTRFPYTWYTPFGYK